MAYKRVADILAGCWEKPWADLSVEQQFAWYATSVSAFLSGIPNAAAGLTVPDDGSWDMNPAEVRKRRAAEYDAQNGPVLAPLREYDATMNAAIWLKRASVKPDEAAMLLCRIDPLERDWQGNPPDPERIYVDGDKASPDRYRLLLRVFLDVAETDPKRRPLLDWREVAKREGLRYHEWIDEYVQAQIEELPADAGSGGTGELIATDTGPVWWRVAREEGNRWYAEKLKAKKKGDPPIEKNQLAEYLYEWLYSKGYRNRSRNRISLSSIREQITGIVIRKKVGMAWK